MTFSVEVECRPDHRGEPTPHVLHFGQTRLEVRELLDSWPGREYQYFKLLGEDGATYIVRHDLPSECWELAFYDSGHGPRQ